MIGAVIVFVVIFSQREIDGPLSAQEQMYILYQVKLQCHHNLSNIDPEATGRTHNLDFLSGFFFFFKLTRETS